MRKIRILSLLLLLLPDSPCGAIPPPKDWSNNEWYLYFEAVVALTAGEAPGAAIQTAGGVAAAPVADVYAALSAVGASTKPVLHSWLQDKMRQAHEAGDLDKLDRYQAFDTALTTGDNTRLKELLEEYERKRRGHGPPPQPARGILILSGLLVERSPDSGFKAIVQYSIDSLPEKPAIAVTFRGRVSGPGGYSGTVSGVFNRGGGYNYADSFKFSLPPGAVEGEYTLALGLGSPHASSSLEKAATFSLRHPALEVGLTGPPDVKEGSAVQARLTIQGGVPPYKWTWVSNGASGEGTGNSGTLVTPDAQGDQIVYTVYVHDCGNYRSQAVVRKLNVKVTHPPMTVGIQGPAETCVGRETVFTARAIGGKGKLVYEWSGSGSPSATLRETFAAAGTRTVTVKVYDEGQHRTNPVVAQSTVTVYPLLEAVVPSPTSVALGQTITLTPAVQGGKPPYSYSWSTSRGGASNNEVFTGRIATDRQPGDLVVVNLEVRDSLTPSQARQVQVQMTARAAEQVRIISVDATPQVEQGRAVTVRVRYQLDGFAAPNVDCIVRTWVETSSGSGTGSPVADQNAQPQGQMREFSSTHPIPGNAQTGVIRVRTTVQAGAGGATADTTSRIVEASGQIVITGIEAAPSSVEPGGSITVKTHYRLEGFGGQMVASEGATWVEGSSGSGQGRTVRKTGDLAPGRPYTYTATVPVSSPARAGPIRIQTRLVAGSVVQIAKTTAAIRESRPGGFKDVTVSQRQIALTIFDHGKEDNDYVQLGLNGKALTGSFKITKGGARFSLNLQPGENRLTVYAVNEGAYPPNTAAISLTHVVQGPSTQSYKLNQGTSGYFLVIAP